VTAFVGRGIIGLSWAVVFARAGLRVRIWCRRENDVATTHDRIEGIVHSLRGTGLAGQSDILEQISSHTSLEDTLRGVHYVQESVSENLDLKRDMFRKIEHHTSADTIIASSTSGLLPSVLAGALEYPDRFLVVHPLTPPHLLPVTEICPSPSTAPSVIDSTIQLLSLVGQRPILVRKEIPGFALNRILAALMNEILTLVSEGAIAPEDVDAMLTEGFGLRWALIGPLAAMDLNAPGGIEDYLLRYGHLWDEVARSRGMTPALSKEVIAQVAGAMRRQQRLEDNPARIARRDHAIAELRKLRTTIPNI
jgi:3-hydroxyacyl-CoA dehydrogenase